MKKKLSFLPVILGILVFLSGCNLKEKISDNITEGILEQALGDGTDIDIADSEFKITSKDGEEIIFNDENGMIIEGEDGSVLASGGVYEWPVDQAAMYLPKLNEGKITYLYNTAGSCLLYLEEISKEAYEDYLNTIIDQGYTESKFESATEDTLIYGAANKDGIIISLYYDKNASYLQITVDSTQKK